MANLAAKVEELKQSLTSKIQAQEEAISAQIKSLDAVTAVGKPAAGKEGSKKANKK